MNRAITAPVRYLPEYLYQEPLRVLRGAASGACASPGFGELHAACSGAICCATRRRTAAGGSARPSSWRASCDAAIRHISRALSAHARLRGPLRRAADRPHLDASRPMPRTSGPRRTGRSARRSPTRLWGVTCTRAGRARTCGAWRPDAGPGVARLSRPRPRPLSRRRPSAARRGTAPTRPIRSASSRSGARSPRRATTTCSTRWRACPADLHWRFAHVGGGELLERSEGARPKQPASATGSRFSARQAQADVDRAPARGRLFVLPSQRRGIGRSGRPAERADGGREPGARDRRDAISPASPNSSATACEGAARAAGRLGAAVERHQSPGARSASAAPRSASAAFERLRRDFFDGRAASTVLEQRFRALLGQPPEAQPCGACVSRSDARSRSTRR